MKKTKKPRRPRTERRARERAARELVKEHERSLHEQIVERERWASLQPGGSPERPIEVASAAVIDLRARAQPCPLCGATLELLQQTAEKIDGRSLRAARMRCRGCHAPRAIWFALTPSLPN